MDAIAQSNKTELWESALGVLPVRLFHSQELLSHKYIMLNGNKNNFGLDLEGSQSNIAPEAYRSYAWSSDVDSFISVLDNEVLVHRWHRQGEERYPKQTVLSNIEKFYSYLEHTTQKKENAIVPYAIRTFRSIRNFINEKEAGKVSLQVFLYLLAAAEENKADFDLSSWGLNDELGSIPKWFPVDKFIDEFFHGLNYSKLRPDINLILRHAAGKLFQEAHYEAVLTGQLNLTGVASSDIRTNKPKYSSVHFTPSYIARSVVEESLNSFRALPKSLNVLDPACGSGEFLKETLRQLKNRNYEGHVRVIGWDISDPAISMARFLLAFEKREWGDKLTIELRKVDDSLKEAWGKEFDLLLMNPPFLSWSLMNTKERESVVSAMGGEYNTNPNMAGAFFWKAINSLKDDGVLGCVLPSAILNAEAYSQLRNKAKEIVNIRLLAKLGNYVFQSSFTDACLLVASKNLFFKPEAKLVWAYNTANAAPDAMRALRKQRFSKAAFFIEKEFSIYSVEDIGQNWMPMKYESWSLKKHLLESLRNEKLKEAKEVFDIRLGARIGNPVFMIDTDFYKQLNTSEKKYFRPVVLNKAIRHGKLNLVSYLFFPKGSYLEQIKEESDLEKHIPTFYAKRLKPKKEELVVRCRTDQRNWWHLSEARAWQYQKSPKLVSTEFGKAGSFAFDESGDYVVERGLAWIPKDLDKFTEDIYFAYVALFCCSFFNDLLTIYSIQLASGWDLSKRYVQNIPIPDFTSEDIYTRGEYTDLVSYGRQLSKGELVEDSHLLSLLRPLYGLN